MHIVQSLKKSANEVPLAAASWRKPPLGLLNADGFDMQQYFKMTGSCGEMLHRFHNGLA